MPQVNHHMRICIAPFACPLKNGKENAKNFPYWNRLVELLKAEGHHVIQLAIHGDKFINAIEVAINKSYDELKIILKSCDTWMSVDTFFNHFAQLHEPTKRGIVLWGKSNPAHFGYNNNVNLFKNKSYFRPDQWRWWEYVDYNADAFVKPEVVMEALKNLA